MKSEGNCGNGDAGIIAGPRHLGWDMLRAQESGKVIIYEVAWHHGKTASATGYAAMRRRRARSGLDA